MSRNQQDKLPDGKCHRHIWIFNHYAIGPADMGGTRHYSLARELTKSGYCVTIFASNWNHTQKKIQRLQDGRPWAVEYINGVRFIWLRTFPYNSNNWRRIVNVLSYSLRALIRGVLRPKDIDKPDVIIGSSVHLLAVIVGRLLAWYYRAYFITEIRDLWPNTLIDAGLISETGLLARLMRRCEFFLYNNSDHIITLLPFASEYICQSGIPKENVTWISNGVELSLYSENSQITPKQESKGGFYIFYTGSHGIYDDLDTIVNCAIILKNRNIKNIKFVLVGDGITKKQLIAKANENNLENIEFRDPVAKHLMPEVLQDADACILVNKDIALYKYGISSNKLFDYLAVGKPVIMVGDIAGNIVEAARCGITVRAEDPELLVAACLDLSNMDSESLHRMGKNGRQHVEEFYSYEYLASRLEKIITTISPDV